MFHPDHARLRARLAAGEDLALVWLALGSPALAEIAARARPDGIVIDMQHGLFCRTGLEAAAGVVPPAIPVLARVAENGFTAIGTALDAGCEGVIVPMVETAREAADAVAAAHYPPRGRRSGGGLRPTADFGAYLAAAAERIAVIVMIETARGVDNAAAIAATPGVDGVLIGSGDLAISLGAAPGSAAYEDAVRAVRAACAAAGVAPGIFTMDAAAARRRREEGFRLVVGANDITLAERGFAEALAALGSGR
ncbi:MAG: hypothetical protein D6686_12945 [Alphaproteobacteria bacterium]|nr:MAG: hypothetical protein D6686_12945 [Alphaproteobacteria bacterium]